MSARNDTPFGPTRAEGLLRLEHFCPAMGEAYARNRNFDLGPDDRSNVSLLSPYVRSRLVLEEELIAKALDKRPLKEVEKFVQEVFWRAYWKGWLELRPQVWEEYKGNLKIHLSNETILERYHAACAGNTPYECFNSWVQELSETGYLHNHARMWFASIWIFYLGLPWELGADFFYRRLLDGDAASNTLSWRWVAGLQTVGKQYVADAANIEKYTGGRFVVRGLNESDVITRELPNAQSRNALTYLPVSESPGASEKPGLLLMNDEDLFIEGSPLRDWKIQEVLGLSPELIQEEQKLSKLALSFRCGALKDGVMRAASHYETRSTLVTTRAELAKFLALAANEKLTLTVMRPRIGYWKDFLSEFGIGVNTSTSQRIAMSERPWDCLLYPQARRGFFNFKELIPSAIRSLNIQHQSGY